MRAFSFRKDMHINYIISLNKVGCVSFSFVLTVIKINKKIIKIINISILKHGRSTQILIGQTRTSSNLVNQVDIAIVFTV